VFCAMHDYFVVMNRLGACLTDVIAMSISRLLRAFILREPLNKYKHK
jgi:hypothetical protein